MARLSREREAKLALLEALASSQKAVARMLASTADLSARFPAGRPEEASALLARLAALQLRMCESLLGVKLRRIRHGRPSAPWLAGGRLRPPNADGGAAGGAGENARAAAVRRHPHAHAGLARAYGMRRGLAGMKGRASSASPAGRRPQMPLRRADGMVRAADGTLTNGREPE